MKCNERQNLFLLVRQMLEPAEADRMRRHVASCSECARAAEDYNKLDAVLDDWSAAEPSPWFDARVRAHVARNTQKERGFFGFGRARVLAAGLASLLLILAGMVVFHHHVVENKQPVISQQQPQAGPGAAQTPEVTEAQRQPLPAAEQLKMDENLSLLEDYDVVSNFDALSELPQANDN